MKNIIIYNDKYKIEENNIVKKKYNSFLMKNNIYYKFI